MKLAAACGLIGPQFAGAWVPEQTGFRLKKEAPSVRYILRIFFPDNQDIEKRTKSLIEFCQKTHTQQVSIFSSIGGLGLQQLSEVRARVSAFEHAFQMLRQAGISPGINVLATIGHGDWLGSSRQEESYPFQWMVGHDGTQTHSSACPLDRNWRTYVQELYALYASLQPDFIYIDDDFRYHAHYPAIFACFCPLHLEAMSGLLGRKVTREELLERILAAAPQPTLERLAWYRLLSGTLVDVARMLTREVHAISPKTRMGLMTSNWSVHAVEGRDWKALLAAIGEFHRPLVRIHMGPYAEYSGKALPSYFGQVTRGPLRVAQASTQVTPEWDTFPTVFSTSVQYYRLRGAFSFLQGVPDIMPNMTEITGAGEEEPAYGEMLANSYPYFQGLLNLAWNCPKEMGVQIAWSDDRPILRRTLADTSERAGQDCWAWLQPILGAVQGPKPCPPLSNPCALATRPCWDGVLDLMGFSTIYSSSRVVALGGEEALERTDEELKALCSGGLLLDAGATREIVRRGFQDWIGVSSVQSQLAVSKEEIVDRDFGAEHYGHLFTVWQSTYRRLTKLPQAKTITRLLGDYDSFPLPGMVLYENGMGGRICTLALEGKDSLNEVTFMNWKRQYVLLNILEWLFRGPVPLFVSQAANVYPFRRDGAEGSMVAIANLSSEGISDVRWQMAAQRKPKDLLLLQKDGELKRVRPELSLKGGYLHVVLKHSIPALDLACFFLSGG